MLAIFIPNYLVTFVQSDKVYFFRQRWRSKSVSAFVSCLQYWLLAAAYTIWSFIVSIFGYRTTKIATSNDWNCTYHIQEAWHNFIDAKCRWRSDRLDGAGSNRELFAWSNESDENTPWGDNPWDLLFSSSIALRRHRIENYLEVMLGEFFNSRAAWFYIFSIRFEFVMYILHPTVEFAFYYHFVYYILFLAQIPCF